MRMRVLITVKTYPLPSTTPLREIVCTAGVREDGTWVRLYPIDFRYRPYEKYGKYQWIELDAVKHKHDKRPETYSPTPDTMITLGEEIKSDSATWAARREIVLAQGTDTMCCLDDTSQFVKSLGIVKPREVVDLIVEGDDREWKADWQESMKTEWLFGPKQKPLEKIPFKFSYKFFCQNQNCSGHTKMIADWEIGQLYRSMRDKFGSEIAAAEKVKERFLSQLCAPDRDTHFFVGTEYRWGKWIILGVFWPKHSLF
jgi:hypothetical protein